MNTVTLLSGASLVAVLHSRDSGFSISEHDRAEPKGFTFVPKYNDPNNIVRLLLEALGDQADRLRHITVVEGGVADDFTQAAKVALVAIAGATGASLSSVDFLQARVIADCADCTSATQVAVALELQRRERKDAGEHLGSVVLAVNHVMQLRNEVKEIRQHVEAAQ